MNLKLVLLALATLTACTGSRSCSTQNQRTSSASTPPPTPLAVPAATPDPAAALRAQLVTRIEKLSDSDCDTLVLRFQLVPRDEILEPLSTPRYELLRYVRRNASADDLADMDRILSERRKWHKQ